MQNSTREKFNAFTAQVGELNGVQNTATKFTIAPSVQQTLEAKIQESSEFLSRINIVGVEELTGQKLALGVAVSIASRTDTTSKDRTPKDVSDLADNSYTLKQTNFDTALSYGKLDMWAKFPNFQTILRDQIVNQQALDRIMIGFNGTSAAADTNATTNPLLQDVNKGWLQQYREKAAERVMTEVDLSGTPEDAGKIVVGAGKHYKNLDALVFDARNNLIDPVYRRAPGMVALVSDDLMSDKLFPLVNDQTAPTEKLAADIVVSQARLGGLQAIAVPYMPAGTVLITSLDNLSIYFQNGKRRRAIIDNPKRDQVENYESSNEGYVVEAFAAGCLIENIELA